MGSCVLIKYHIFNPLVGTYVNTEDKVTAFEIYNNIYNEVLSTRRTITLLPLLPEFADDWYKAYILWCKTTNQQQLTKQEALDTIFNSVTNQLGYSHSVYNLTTKEYWSNTFQFWFEGKEWHIKVTKGEVSDLYTRDVTINAVHYDWVTYNLTTNEMYEYYISEGNDYMKTGSTLSKYYFEDKRFDSITYYVSCFDDLPSEQRVMLFDMPWKDGISAWCQKSYGFIVEYRKAWNYQDLNNAQKVIYDRTTLENEERAIQETNDMVIINKAIVDENGNETWIVINKQELEE